MKLIKETVSKTAPTLEVRLSRLEGEMETLKNMLKQIREELVKAMELKIRADVNKTLSEEKARLEKFMDEASQTIQEIETALTNELRDITERQEIFFNRWESRHINLINEYSRRFARLEREQRKRLITIETRLDYIETKLNEIEAVLRQAGLGEELEKMKLLRVRKDEGK